MYCLLLRAMHISGGSHSISMEQWWNADYCMGGGGGVAIEAQTETSSSGISLPQISLTHPAMNWMFHTKNEAYNHLHYSMDNS
jgi:hypothetical protein